MMGETFRNWCLSFKWGEYDALVCCRDKGHDGPHAHVVATKAALAEHARRRGIASAIEQIAQNSVNQPKEK